MYENQKTWDKFDLLSSQFSIISTLRKEFHPALEWGINETNVRKEKGLLKSKALVITCFSNWPEKRVYKHEKVSYVSILHKKYILMSRSINKTVKENIRKKYNLHIGKVW